MLTLTPKELGNSYLRINQKSAFPRIFLPKNIFIQEYFYHEHFPEHLCQSKGVCQSLRYEITVAVCIFKTSITLAYHCWDDYRLPSSYFIFLGSKITVDSDCSHETKRRLIFGKKSYNKYRERIKKHRLWGCWGWQAARTWVSVSPEMVGFPAPIR